MSPEFQGTVAKRSRKKEDIRKVGQRRRNVC
jgi:hypothetical protein